MPYYPSYPTSNEDDRLYSDPSSLIRDKKPRPGTPSSKRSVQNVPKVTPGSTARKKPRIQSSSRVTGTAAVTPGDKHGDRSTTASTFSPSSPFVALRDSDIVCGRGAPTNFHVGNSRFRELVLDYHRSYFVAKRSDKPRIAMKVLDVLSERGARFVRRVKGRGSSTLSSQVPHWEEVANKIAYEKVCQALRDAGTGGYKQQRHKMLSSVAIASVTTTSLPSRHASGGSDRHHNDNVTQTTGDDDKPGREILSEHTTETDGKENNVAECY